MITREEAERHLEIMLGAIEALALRLTGQHMVMSIEEIGYLSPIGPHKVQVKWVTAQGTSETFARPVEHATESS
jgi:hypothetical protein